MVILLDVIARGLWLFAGAMAILALVFFMSTRYSLDYSTEEISAPQLAALAAECLVMAVIPYVLARSWDELFRKFR